MTHLGDRVAALVDDQLPPDVRDRLLGHLAVCQQCRREVEDARQLKQRLAGLRSPAPSDRLTHRLVAMSEPGEPMPTEPSAMPWGRRDRPEAVGWPVAGRLGSRRSRHLRRAAAAVSVSAATLGFAFALGDEADGGLRPVVPPVDRFVVEHAATTSDVPLSEPAVSAVTVDGGTTPLTPGPGVPPPVPGQR